MTDIDKEIMDAYTVIFDGLQHLGPGDPGVTRQVVERISSELPPRSRIADFGCGTGASTLLLAECLPQARILALDMHAPFIAQLGSAAEAAGLGERICAVAGDMGNPPPLDGVTGEFDLVWSESAIYSIGRGNALTCWRSLLKPGGWLVFSDIVWSSNADVRNKKVAEFWETEYPDITTTDAVLDELTSAGYITTDPVLTSRVAWANYYEPLGKRLDELSEHENRSQALVEVMTELEKEIEIYDSAGDEVAVAFFIAKF